MTHGINAAQFAQHSTHNYSLVRRLACVRRLARARRHACARRQTRKQNS